MYYRIKNRLDAEALADEITKSDHSKVVVADRIKEIVDTLDDAYGADRTSFAMGGYVLYFPDYECYRKNIENISGFYNFDLNGYEYTEVVGEKVIGKQKWIESLFILSSDDSLVLIYPQEVANV